jgi:hypothetical protein
MPGKNGDDVRNGMDKQALPGIIGKDEGQEYRMPSEEEVSTHEQGRL